MTDNSSHTLVQQPISDEKPNNEQPDRFLTPQPPNQLKRKSILEGKHLQYGQHSCHHIINQSYTEYQPTPPPASVTVHNTVSASSKDPCWLGW